MYPSLWLPIQGRRALWYIKSIAAEESMRHMVSHVRPVNYMKDTHRRFSFSLGVGTTLCMLGRRIGFIALGFWKSAVLFSLRGCAGRRPTSRRSSSFSFSRRASSMSLSSAYSDATADVQGSRFSSSSVRVSGSSASSPACDRRIWRRRWERWTSELETPVVASNCLCAFSSSSFSSFASYSRISDNSRSWTSC